MFLPSMSSGSATAVKPRSIKRSKKAPTSGWDTRENIADMPEDTAVILDNWFPDSDRITTRNGYTSFATGMTGNINSLMAYDPDSGSKKLFAANASKIYSAGTNGPVGAAIGSGFSSDKWEYVNMGTSGGRFLFMVNGVDAAQLYDGSSLSATTLTGPDKTKLAWCNMHQRRLWAGEKNSLSAWYGGVNSITGAFTEFPLYGVANKGGYLTGMATWTRDSGQGQDDVAVFMTSEGEAIVYSGIDPSSADTWSLVGVFQLGKPIGRRFFTKAGGDLILLTQDGFVSAAGMLVTDRTQAQKVAISAQINKTVNQVIRNSSQMFGWQPILYPRGTMLIVNIPIDVQTSHQYVFNTLTKAPCRFTGQNANCWAVFNDELYFGGKDGKVYKADDGHSDNGTAISCDVLPAFSYFGSPGLMKKFNMGEAIFQADTAVTPAFDLNTDFRIRATTAIPSEIDGSGGKWDQARWDVDRWGSDQDIYRAWKSISGLGTAASLRTRIENQGPQVSLLALNYIYESAGLVG